MSHPCVAPTLDKQDKGSFVCVDMRFEKMGQAHAVEYRHDPSCGRLKLFAIGLPTFTFAKKNPHLVNPPMRLKNWRKS